MRQTRESAFIRCALDNFPLTNTEILKLPTHTLPISNISYQAASFSATNTLSFLSLVFAKMKLRFIIHNLIQHRYTLCVYSDIQAGDIAGG
jgi:hypothetical protein